MKILIIGFGSIGQRHYKNLFKLGYKDVWVFDIDGEKIRNIKLKVRMIDSRVLREFNAVFICNPNDQHIKTALKCAQAGCHLFIEKPLSHNLKNIDKLEKVCQRKKLINMVACNMRFHPCFKFIKDYLAKNKLGQVYSISNEFGYYLPFWRPGTDYRKNYAAKKSTGGGIILDDIHEFDLLFWLNNFIEAKEAKFIYGRISNLQIETEDYCLANFKFKNHILGQVKCDYLQKSYTRRCKVVGARGNLEWDFNENIIWLKNGQGNKKLFAVENFDFNKVYIDEVKYFFSCLAKKRTTFNNIKTAYEVLKYCVNKQ